MGEAADFPPPCHEGARVHGAVGTVWTAGRGRDRAGAFWSTANGPHRPGMDFRDRHKGHLDAGVWLHGRTGSRRGDSGSSVHIRVAGRVVRWRQGRRGTDGAGRGVLLVSSGHIPHGESLLEPVSDQFAGVSNVQTSVRDGRMRIGAPAGLETAELPIRCGIRGEEEALALIGCDQQPFSIGDG